MAAKQKMRWAILLAALLALVVDFFYWWASLHYALYAVVCDPASGHHNCPGYNPLFAWALSWAYDFNYWGALVTAVATVAIAWFTFSLRDVTAEQGRLTQKTLDLGRDEFNATHRPVLYVRNMTLINNDGRTIFAPGAPGVEIKGRFIVANKGGTPAEIVAGHLEVCWSDASVPSEYIYKTDTPTDTTKTTIKPGRYQPVDFTSGSLSMPFRATGKFEDTTHGSTTILGRVATTGYVLRGDRPPTLYVFGWLRFEDGSHNTWQMGFCREWSDRERAFLPVNNPDFEYEA